METFRVKTRERARKMLYKHEKFLARVSIPASERLFQEYNIAIQTIKRNPYGYPYIDEKRKHRRYIFYKRYLIIYLVEKNIICIEYIVDTRQNYFKIF